MQRSPKQKLAKVLADWFWSGKVMPPQNSAEWDKEAEHIIDSLRKEGVYINSARGDASGRWNG